MVRKTLVRPRILASAESDMMNVVSGEGHEGDERDERDERDEEDRRAIISNPSQAERGDGRSWEEKEGLGDGEYEGSCRGRGEGLSHREAAGEDEDQEVGEEEEQDEEARGPTRLTVPQQVSQKKQR